MVEVYIACSASSHHLKQWRFLSRPAWISLWIKSITNEFRYHFHVLTSQLSGLYDVISNQLWRHQQNINRVSETRDDMGRSSLLLSFMDSLCYVRNKIIYVPSWRTVHSLQCYFGVYFLRYCETREINTQITLSWALKWFDTRVLTSFLCIVNWTLVNKI